MYLSAVTLHQFVLVPASNWKSPESHKRQQAKQLLIYPRDDSQKKAALRAAFLTQDKYT